MDTAQHPAESQQEQSIVENDEELQSFIPSGDVHPKSTSNMNSLRLTTPRSSDQPQEPSSGVATTARKRGKPKKRVGLALPAPDEPSKDSTVGIADPAKRRGRPKKRVSFDIAEATAGSAPEEVQGKSATLGQE
jgi:hypothetical protein